MSNQARIAMITHQHLADPATGSAMIPWVSPIDHQADLAMRGGTYPNESWFVVAKLTVRRDDMSASVTTCRHRLPGRSV